MKKIKATQNIDLVQGEGYINIIKGMTLFARIPFSHPSKHIIGDMTQSQAQVFANKVKAMIDKMPERKVSKNFKYKGWKCVWEDGVYSIIDPSDGLPLMSASNKDWAMHKIDEIVG